MSLSRVDQLQTAQYIADMVLELRNLAKAADLRQLQEALELACYAAFHASHRSLVPEGETERVIALGADARKARL
jgi:hypothetical protein